MSYVILGGGSVTAEFYLPAFRLMGRLAEVTVVDPFETSLAPLREVFPEANFKNQDHADFLAGLAPGEDERIIIALPNAMHVAAAEQALAGGRHTLCEKPLALKPDQCARLAEVAARAGRRLNVAMSRRYLPSLMLARDIVASKELGEVRSILVHDCMPFGWKPRSFAFFSREAGGVLADMGVHYLDYLDTLIGPMTPLSYEDDAKGGTESSLTYRLAAGEVDVEVTLSRIHRSGEYIEIRCERGDIHIDKTRDQEVLVTPHGLTRRRIQAEQPFTDPKWPTGFHGSFCQMLADFELGLSSETSRLADASDAGRTAALIDWAYSRPAKRPTLSAKASSGDGKVLVTGATGFIGGRLVDRLCAEGRDVRVIARAPSSCTNVSRFPVELVSCDLLNRDSVRAAVEGVKTVYHLAYGTDGGAPARLTIDGTKNVVEAAIEAGCESVVVLSTMYVFGFPEGGRAVDETFPYRPYGGEYGESKAVMEKWCLERARTSLPTRIAILNPTCVFGPAGGAYTTLPIDLARIGQFAWIDEGAGYCNYTYVENVVDAVIGAAGLTEAHGERMIINDGVATWRSFFEPLLAPLNIPLASYSLKQLKRLPRFGEPFKARDLLSAIASSDQIRAVAKRSELIRGAFAVKQKIRPSPPMGATLIGPAEESVKIEFPPEWIGPLYGPQQVSFSAAKAGKILGWTPRITLAEAQAATLQWLILDGRLPGRAEISWTDT